MKRKTILSIILVSLLTLTLVAPVYASTRFDPYTALHTVTTQAHADALPPDIDARGWDIAILVKGSNIDLSGLEIHGAVWFGIAVDEQSGVNVMNCEIYEIGDHSGDQYAPTGGQHGLGVYYYASSGEISGNTVYAYQKGGIIANLPETNGEAVYILDNTVTGLGPVDFIAQNGIQVGWQAKAVIRGNTVSGNYYVDFETPGKGKAIGKQSWVSCGILLYDIDPSNVKRSKNLLRDNQVNFYIYPHH